MSFITKRDRVFNEYDLFDLPARNEGKLKAYASCTDARAWSHFCSDKSEHLVEIIKRNNETCRPKYVPTDAIINTLMAGKNAEIGRLKRKIEEFEQMLAAYDQLELTCDQKCEIANAHAAIKAANKELDDLCLDLDLSGFTEGIDSEAFETGKSRGDEASVRTSHEVPKTKENEWEVEKEPTPVMESKANQTCPKQPHDASTSAHDSRIDDLQDVIITKDAKLSAMQNTLAVMENDICEPYCIYAHIYTALEKIFGTLCQNKKYKEYLDLLTAGKDTRSIDVKGKILFKLKVLEKFAMALIAPCSQEKPSQSTHECSCYRAQVVAHVETTFALTSPTSRNTNLDSKRALLVADIMDNQEIKEILSKDSISSKIDDDHVDESYGVDSYSIETENLNRLKNLQANYDDLLNCYENLKYEKNCLVTKCKKYDELEKEFDSLKSRLKEYNLLWSEKEHYRKRSEDLDSLKQQFLILSEETLNIETQLKAETEINKIKCKALNELRCENIDLEKKISDMAISFEKEKNIFTCKLKEYECKIMCQEQQIKSLSIQVDQLLEQDKVPSNFDSTKALELTDQIESLKQQVQNFKNALICNEEEKQQLQEEFTKKLELINELKMEIEDKKSNYETAIRSQNLYLEKYTKKYQDELQTLRENNRALSKEIEIKSGDIEKFIAIINNKSQEINKLMEELERRNNENLYLQNLTENFDRNISSLENEKKNALLSLQLARTDSQKLIKNYDDDNDKGNERCAMNIMDRDNENSALLQEIEKLRADNISNISKMQDENIQNKKSLEVLKKESLIMKHKLVNLENLSQQLHNLKESHDRLLADKIRLENELHHKTTELENVIHLTRRESETLMGRVQQSESFQQQLNNNYQNVLSEKYSLLSDLSHKDEQIRDLSDSLNALKDENGRLHQELQHMHNLEQEFKNLNNAYEHLVLDKNMLQNDFDNKTKEIDNLYNSLESKIDENRALQNQIKNLQYHDISNKNSITALQNENLNIQTNLDTLRKESVEVIDKLKYYENLENDFEKLRSENNNLQNDMETQTINLQILQDKNKELNNYSQNLLTHNEELEKALIDARKKLISNSDTPQELLHIKNEIDIMKQEKITNHQKIKKLIDQLDESEYMISKLSEDILARNDKISLLENHINELQDEVRRLHSTLDELTESSTQIKDYSLLNLDQSLKRMEAHHSKATHDMRVELAKLQNKSTLLENQLSVTKLKSEESIRDMNKHISEITHLQNEREAIVNNIRQLEIKSIGDSILSPTNCSVEDILASINKIMKYFESRELKNSSLEKTLLKVQSSFQLVLDKADEEKKIVDIEKQKLLNEKEAALIDLNNVEKTLVELKSKYEEQIAQDRRTINDLEAEISNQNLIFDKINKSKTDYISKLEEKIKSLREMYDTSISKVSELQEILKSNSEDNQKNMNLIEEANLSLTEKSKEMEILKQKLHNLMYKSVQSVGTEIDLCMNKNDKSTETHKEFWDENIIIEPTSSETMQKLGRDDNNLNIKVTKSSRDNIISEILPKQEPYSLNEVQILRANVDIFSLDSTKTAYINYKIKRLNFGPMEKCSISSLSNLQDSSKEKICIHSGKAISTSALKDTLTRCNNVENANIIDVYNLQPLYVNSAQKMHRTDGKIMKKIKMDNNQSRSSSSLCDLNNAKSNIEDIKKHRSDKDLFVIYKDSSSNKTSPTDNNKNELLELYNKDQLQHSNNMNKSETSTSQHKKKRRSKNKSISQTKEDKYLNETKSNKPKLQIDLPRIEAESSSVITTSDGDNKSLDSYTYAIYSSPKKTYSDKNIKNQQNSSNIPLYGSPNELDKLSHEEQIHDIFFHNKSSIIRVQNIPEFNDESSNKIDASLPKINSSQPQNTCNVVPKKTQIKTDSHHKLSRVGANVLLVEYSDEKSTNDTLSSQHTNDSQETLKSENFGLQYILDTMKCENNPQNFKIYNKLKSLQKSNDKKHKRLESLQSLSNVPDSSVISNFNNAQEANQKSFSEFGVLVKMDSMEDYENKIHHLTKALENIEKDYKKKIDAVKVQYDSNIKSIINEHNQGVKSIQSLHEETLQDVIKIHENEVESLRTMSIEALRKVEKLEKENHTLKTKMYDNPSTTYDEEPIKISTPDTKKRRGRCRIDTKMLSKTNVEAFNVKPKTKSHGPCTCSLDMNISDTIRNIFEQVDAEQRKVAENAYLKYIANKISNNNIEALDAQELSFLHLKVCRTWKTKLSKEEALQKRIDSLEIELINKQRQAQQHMADLDRKVAEERRRLQEVREAVCRNSPDASRDGSPEPTIIQTTTATITCEKTICSCNPVGCNTDVGGRGSAGDLGLGLSGVSKNKRSRVESNRAVLAKLDADERRDRKFYDDPPIRLKRSHDRPTLRKK